jgi:hypothetical protein
LRDEEAVGRDTAMPGKKERKFRKVAGIHVKVDVGPVKRAIEEIAAIANDEIAIHRPVAERTRRIAGE